MRHRLLLLAAASTLTLPGSALAQATNPTPPRVTTAAASSITVNAANIAGTVDPNGAATSYQLEYGTTTSYGLKSASRSAGNGTEPVAINVPLTGLTSNTAYHYRLVATNAAGISRTGDRSFRTKATLPPVVQIGTAGPITARAAAVTGTVNPRGRPTSFRFEYGVGTKTNQRTAAVDVGGGTAAVPVASTLTLVPNTKYSYRLTATNSAGTVRSPVRTLRAPSECTTSYPPKLSIARAVAARGLLDVLAPISSRASGAVSVDYSAAQQHTSFSVPVGSTARHVRFRRSVTRAQARLGTGIVTISYAGDSDTQPQTVRLRAAANKARLNLARPRIVDGHVQAAGTISGRAHGVVRLQLGYQFNCAYRLLEFGAPITDGRWSIDAALSAQSLAEIGARSGPVQSYALFTGYLPTRIRGEMRAFQVLGNP